MHICCLQDIHILPCSSPTGNWLYLFPSSIDMYSLREMTHYKWNVCVQLLIHIITSMLIIVIGLFRLFLFTPFGP